MAVVEALSSTVATLRREPALIPLVFVVNLPLVYLNQLDLLLGSNAEWLGNLLSILVAPAVLGALFGVLDEVTDGEPLRVGRLVDHALANYPSLLGANLLLLVGVFVGALALAVLAMIPVLNILVFLAAIPLAVFVGMVLQFVNVAVVVGGEDAVSTFDASYRLVEGNLASVFGYSLLRLVVVLGFAAPTLASALRMAPGTGGLERVTLGPEGALLVAVGGLSAILLLPLHVHYFKALRGGSRSGPRAAETSTPADPTTGPTGRR